MKIVIVTGMSGAGKSTALNMLEDEGYYCVDNMPISLIPKFAELADCQEQDNGYSLEDLEKMCPKDKRLFVRLKKLKTIQE